MEHLVTKNQDIFCLICVNYTFIPIISDSIITPHIKLQQQEGDFTYAH